MAAPNPIADDPPPLRSMSLLDHLNELRIRLTYAAVAVFVGTLLGFLIAEPLLHYLLQPYANSLPAGSPTLQTIRVTESLETFFKVSLLFGAILAMPMVLYQVWLFVAPALTEVEKRYVYIFIPGAFGLFSLGILFSWFILIPAAIHFLATFMQDIFRAEWTGQDYIGFVSSMLFWMGASFQMPIIIYILARVGFVSVPMLVEHWRYAIVLIAIMAATITPSIDPITMLLTMAPLTLLYGLSIFLAKIGQKQFERSVSVQAS